MRWGRGSWPSISERVLTCLLLELGHDPGDIFRPRQSRSAPDLPARAKGRALIHASHPKGTDRGVLERFGIKVSPELHLPTMMVQKQASVDALGHGIEFLFHKNQGRSDRSLGPACRAGQCSRAQTMLAIEYFQKGNLAMTLARLKSVAGIPIPDTTLCSRDRLAGIELT